MGKIVIIGAGPIGLYLAINLYKKGFKDIVVYDPRAGIYKRPGVLNYNAIQSAIDSLGMLLEEPENNDKSIRIRHIKNVERDLWLIAHKLRINIERKEFISFAENETTRGIWIRDIENAVDEFISCDYIFDCTGSARKIVYAVNALNEANPPFKLTPVHLDIKVKTHFLAYIKMSNNDLSHILSSYTSLLRGRTEISSERYVQAIERLRKLGWKQFSFPYCGGDSFGQNKACLYLEAPDHLVARDYEAWVEAVIQEITASPLFKVEQLPSSKKYDPKPRFGTFQVFPRRLNSVVYKNNQLPVLFVHGDALLDPNFILAHGVNCGFERVDAMIASLSNGTLNDLNDLDEEVYTRKINSLLDKQTKDIFNLYQKKNENYSNWLFKALEHYAVVLFNTVDENKRLLLTLTIEDLIRSIDNFSHSLNDDELAQENIKIKFLDRQRHALTAISLLPTTLAQERSSIQYYLYKQAIQWLKLGDSFYNEDNFEEALEAYNEVLLYIDTQGASMEIDPQKQIISDLIERFIHYLTLFESENYQSELALLLKLHKLGSRYRSLIPEDLYSTLKAQLIKAGFKEINQATLSQQNSLFFNVEKSVPQELEKESPQKNNR